MSGPESDWAARYAAANTPWDLGGPHPELAARLDRLVPLGGTAGPGRACVPGCGRGHDARLLAAAGWEVTAVDVVPELQRFFPPEFHGRFLATDALALIAPPFDLLWEHTFFCALEPEQRPRYGAMARRLLRPGGLLAALVFPVGKEPGQGPPYAMSTAALAEALGPEFRLLRDHAARHPGPGRLWGERWAEFQRS